VSATVVWTILGDIWTLPYSAYDRSVLTFIAGSITIPLAVGAVEGVQDALEVLG
jgi:hypothetical protein